MYSSHMEPFVHSVIVFCSVIVPEGLQTVEYLTMSTELELGDYVKYSQSIQYYFLLMCL